MEQVEALHGVLHDLSVRRLKEMLRALDPEHIAEMQDALSTMSRLLSHYADLT